MAALQRNLKGKNMQNSTHITNDHDALVLALRLVILAINAPDDDEASKKCVHDTLVTALRIAENIAHNLNESEVSKAKIEALTTNEEQTHD